MIFNSTLPFISEFVENLNQSMKEINPKYKLSKSQCIWLNFCLMGILLSNQICWTRFEQIGLGGYKLSALSWMFRHSKILWPILLHASITLVLKRYGINTGELVGDDSDRQRAKITKRIFAAYKVFDKKTGGYFNGQTIVLLYLVTAKVSLPVGFRFYQPDPVVVEWKKYDDKQKKQGIKKSERPSKPEANPAYPNKLGLMIELLQEFKFYHPQILVKAILADALYGNIVFMKQATKVFNNVQIISQLSKVQKVLFRNREMSLVEYFTRYPGIEIRLPIRGGKEVMATLGSARLWVKAHGQKRFVVALKYEGEKDYRYLVASDMSWRAVDIATAYTLRWLVEVFFEDWKLYEGWGQFAPQFDEEGSSYGLTRGLVQSREIKKKTWYYKENNTNPMNL